jgi:hypothetical protein
MRPTRLRYDLRAVGLLTAGLPLLVTLIYLAFTAIVYNATLRGGGTLAYARFQALRGVIGLLENGLPLAAGLVAASAAVQDPVLELHLTLARRYRSTVALRLALVTLGVLLLAGVVFAAAVAAGFWESGVLQPLPEGPLIWLAPVLAFGALGAALALALRSRAAGSAVVGLLWIAQFLFKPLWLENGPLRYVYAFLTEEDGIPAYWLANRLTLLALALALGLAVLYLVGRDEALLAPEA